MPESRSGLRMARVWKTNASISMPVPATTQAMMVPVTPVAVANRAGKENTPAPTIDPTTIAVRVGSVILAGVVAASCSTVVIGLFLRGLDPFDLEASNTINHASAG
jgi:hypothetical protein